MKIVTPICGNTVVIAYQAENNRTQVRFDLSDIVREFPGGTAALVIRRHGDTDPVPAASAVMDGTALVWTVNAWECAKKGFLHAQVIYSAGDTVAKTKIYRFDVADSITATAEEPDGWQDWVGQLTEAAAEVVEAVESYDTMTAEAEGLAAGSAPTAEIDHTGDTPVLKLGIPAGANGYSPSASVSKVGKKATITITDQQGTTTAEISDGTDGADVIDDTAGSGDTGKTWSADKIVGELGEKYEKPAGGIPATDLASAAQTSLGKADTAYQKPAGGIPATDLASGVIPDPTSIIDDTAGAGDTDKTFSADKLATDHSSLLNAIERLDNSKAPIIIDSASGAIATFPDGADGLPLESLVVGIEPVQSGTGDPSPSNVRPITGWTGCNIQRTGKNLFDKSKTDTNNGFVENYYLNGTDGTENGSSNYNISEYIPVKGNVDYVISAISGSNPGYVIYNGSKEKIAFAKYSSLSSITFTTPANAQYIRISIPKANIDSLQLEVGSSASSYEPYQGNTCPITWQTAGTVYGGTVNPVTGKLVVTHGYKDLGTLSWSLVDSTNHVFNASIPEDAYSIAVNETMSGACSSYAIVKANQFASVADNSFFQGWQGFYKNKWNIKDTAQSDASAFQTAMSGVMLAYHLAEPLEYDIDSITVNTLLGYNAIFADTGDVTVDYRADTRLFVEKTEIAGVQDVKVNGTSVVTDGVANVPLADANNPGTVKVDGSHGLSLVSGQISVYKADTATAKGGTNQVRPIVPYNQHEAAFYGMAKAAGDTTQSSSSNAVGNYTDEAKSKIQDMIGLGFHDIGTLTLETDSRIWNPSFETSVTEALFIVKFKGTAQNTSEKPVSIQTLNSNQQTLEGVTATANYSARITGEIEYGIHVICYPFANFGSISGGASSVNTFSVSSMFRSSNSINISGLNLFTASGYYIGSGSTITMYAKY